MHEIKVENKNIIITDPCYLDNVMDENDKTVGLCDYWRKFLAGTNGEDYTPSLQKFGFHDCIACPTLYGDWSCTAYLVDFDPRDIKTVDDIKTIFEQQTMRDVGHFCADAGIVRNLIHISLSGPFTINIVLLLYHILQEQSA